MQRLGQAVALDGRSLAAFRFLAGAMVAWDVLWNRLSHVTELLSDGGMMPRVTALSGEVRPEVFMSSGSTMGVVFLLWLLFACAALFAVGYRTRVTGWLTWLLVTGLQMRAPLTIHEGDTLLRTLLFFGNFLPLGAWWSIDRGIEVFHNAQRERCDSHYQAKPKQHQRSSHEVASVAVLAFVAQIACCNLFGSLAKSGNPEWTESYSAIYIILNTKHLASIWGYLVSGRSWILLLSTFWAAKWEFWSAIAMFVPFPSVRLGIALTMMTFSWLQWLMLSTDVLFCAPLFAASVALLPASFWELAKELLEPARKSQAVLLVNLNQWASSRLAFLLHTFFLADDSVKLSFLHLDQDEVVAREWFLLTHTTGDVRKGTAALEELTQCCYAPVSWILGYSVRRFRVVIEGIGASLSTFRDSNSPLLYKRPPKALQLPTGEKQPKTPSRSCRTSVGRAGKTAVSIFLLACVWCVLSHNLAALGYTSPPGSLVGLIGSTTALQQRWDTFATPQASNSWYKLRGLSWSGQEMSLLEGGLFSWSSHAWDGFAEPKSIIAHLGTPRIAQFLQGALERNVGGSREHLVRYICSRWKAVNAPPAASLKFVAYKVTQPIAPDKVPHQEPVELFQHSCATGGGEEGGQMSAKADTVVPGTLRVPMIPPLVDLPMKSQQEPPAMPIMSAEDAGRVGWVQGRSSPDAAPSPDPRYRIPPAPGQVSYSAMGVPIEAAVNAPAVATAAAAAAAASAAAAGGGFAAPGEAAPAHLGGAHGAPTLPQAGSGGVGEMMDRSAPWKNIVGGSNNGETASVGGGGSGTTLHSLIKQWARLEDAPKANKGQKTARRKEGASKKKVEKRRKAVINENRASDTSKPALAKGMWINGKWVVRL